MEGDGGVGTELLQASRLLQQFAQEVLGLELDYGG